MSITDDERQFLRQFRAAIDRQEERSRLLVELHHDLASSGALGRYVLAKYMCQKRSCQIATVFRYGGLNLCAVRDYKLSPGLNQELSVESARKNNTIDGSRHWPGHVFDLDELASFGQNAGMSMNCRHVGVTVRASDVLDLIGQRRPGRGGPPVRL